MSLEDHVVGIPSGTIPVEGTLEHESWLKLTIHGLYSILKKSHCPVVAGQYINKMKLYENLYSEADVGENR